MEHLSAPKSSTVLTYGLYLGLASVLNLLIVNYGGLMGNVVVGLVWYAILIAILVLGLKHYKEKINSGFLKYGQGLGLSTLIGLVGGVIYGVFSYVLYTIIDPSVHEKLVAISQEKALEQGTTEAQLEQAEGILNIFLSPASVSVMTVVGAVFWAFVFSLVIAAIVKKDPEPTF
ncbi:DUF4199 domain-containing protein [Plebeiibacterium marinum]|uniref:DUF4199 domain-containing protein n=1 Tax=Plebeiibacterium marinum TaxID=2992111 RepID=A0AAE3MHZ9_9BACT|nr:DUF4199 domain-containing protein [Plebeiobacterium marinum]MCW3807826.1 DUF4199 domain-containing protein [Plebeiobacterium marinum]